MDEEFFEIVRRIQKETGIKNTDFSPERLILRQVNEAIYCLQGKIVTAEDIDFLSPHRRQGGSTDRAEHLDGGLSGCSRSEAI